MGLGRVLGGALQGYGNGIAQEALSEAEERKKIALENLRSANAREERTHNAELQDNLNANSTARQTQSQLVTIGAKSKAQERRDDKQRGFEVNDREDNQAHQSNMAVLKGKIDQASYQVRQADAKNEIAGSTVDGKTGEIIFYTKGGIVLPSGIVATDKERGIEAPKASGSDSILGNLGGRGPVAPAAAGPKTMTQADIDKTAKDNNMDAASAKLILEQMGYRLAK